MVDESSPRDASPLQAEVVRLRRRVAELENTCLRQAQRAAKLGSWKWTERTQELELSDELYRMLGIQLQKGSPSALFSQILKMIPVDEHPKLDEVRQRVREERSFFPLETRLVYPDGSTRVIYVEADEYGLDEQGNVAYLTGIVQDITERKQAEDLQKELEVLRGINQLRDELISNVSHELRTPLGLILVMVTALRKDDLSLPAGVRQEFLQDIEEETRSLQGIVSNLLDTSQLYSGRMVLHLKKVDLSKIILKLAEQMRRHAPHHPIICRHPSRPVLAEVDAQRMEQVLLNLLDNAVKYSPAGKNITITISQSRGEIRVQIQDQGKALSQAEYERIFDRFYRIVDRNGPAASGLGLGLAISRGIVEAHGGRLWGESWPEGGSLFTFTLPRQMDAGARGKREIHDAPI